MQRAPLPRRCNLRGILLCGRCISLPDAYFGLRSTCTRPQQPPTRKTPCPQAALHEAELRAEAARAGAAAAQREAAAAGAASEAAAQRLREREADVLSRVAALEEEQAQLRARCGLLTT